MAAKLALTFDIPITDGKDAAGAASIRCRECVQNGRSYVWSIIQDGLTQTIREQIMEFAKNTAYNFRMETLDGSGTAIGSRTYEPLAQENQIMDPITTRTALPISDAAPALIGRVVDTLGDALTNSNKAITLMAESMRKQTGDIPDSFMTLFREEQGKTQAAQAEAAQLRQQLADERLKTLKNATPQTTSTDVLKEIRGTITELKGVDPEKMAAAFLEAIGEGKTQTLRDALGKMTADKRKQIIVMANLAYLDSTGKKTEEELLAEGLSVQQAIITEIDKRSQANNANG